MMKRKELLSQMSAGLGSVALPSLLNKELNASEQIGHSKPKAKAVIQLLMNGGPSQVDTFDYKPMLEKFHGDRPKAVDLKTERPTGGLMRSPWEFKQYGQSGIHVNDIYKHTGSVIDDICTGCELCIEPCPVDCIEMRPTPETIQNWQWDLNKIAVKQVD